MDTTFPCEITHPSGLMFRINVTETEFQKISTDEDYAKQVQDKYFHLYKSGFVSAVNDQTQEENMPLRVSGQQRQQSLSTEDEETLIRLVMERPPLYNFRLPLRERSREKIRSLWQEVIHELNIDITIEDIAKRWKNMRDSFMRVRANIKKKVASGSSAEEKLQAEKLIKSHKHYDLLLFLEDTLTERRTSSNLDERFDEDEALLSQVPSSTPSTSRSSSRPSSRHDLSSSDQAFLEAIKGLPTPREPTPTQNFCRRLADGLEKLPPRIRNQLEVEFLQKLTEMENLYLYSE